MRPTKMGDPTGLSGIVVSKLVDAIILETTNTIYCKQYFKVLEDLLENIRPLIASAEAIDSQPNKTVVEGSPNYAVVKTWLTNLDRVLNEAHSMVCKWNQKKSQYNLLSRNRMSRRVLNVTKQIQELSSTQAPLAALAALAALTSAVRNQLEKIESIRRTVNRLELELIKKNVGDTTKITLEIEGISPNQAFQVIKNETDIYASTVHTTGGAQTKLSTYASFEDDTIPRVVPDLHFIFGMDVPLARLEALLLDDNLSWVGVWGKGGIGKTLLGERAYNSKKVQSDFEKSIWLTVGRNPDIARLQRKLCSMLRIQPDESKEDTKAKLSHKLARNKVLFVLDDVWDFVDLEWLDVNSGSKTGSKTLVTTRNIEVLKMKTIPEESTVRMERLSNEDSQKVFCQYAFGGVDKIPSRSLEKLVIQVRDQCKGLPLALRVTAGALAGQETVEQWQRALNKLQEAEALDQTHEEQLYKRLQLSYDALESLEVGHLEGRLQKCFIYFAGFAEDSDVDVDSLVDLWAGEKLLETSEDDGNDPAPDGYSLLGVLIGRSLIDLQVAQWSHNVNSKKLQCRIHDVLRDLALHLVGQKNARIDCLFKAGRGLKEFPKEWLLPARPSFLERLGGTTSSSLDSKVTHLSLNDNPGLNSLPAKLKAPALEVLLLANCYSQLSKPVVVPPGFLESFFNLKVLDLSHTRIVSLPESVGALTNLIYLNLSFTELCTLPRGLRKLGKLENLNLQSCGKMEPWPFEISSLKSLLSLNTRGCGSELWKPRPAGFPGVRSFDDPLVSLCSLTLLTNLSISDDRKQLPSEMSALVNLRHLSLYCGSLQRLPSELGAINEPRLSKLQYLSFDNCTALDELPPWMDSLSQLTVLILAFTSLRSLPDLHKLQRIQKLDISFCTKLDRLPAGFSMAGAFPSLKELFMMNCTSLREFPPIEEGAFEELTDLNLVGCAFQNLPSSLRLLPSLVKLNLNLSRNLRNLDNCFWLEADSTLASSSTGAAHHPTSQHITFFPCLQVLELKGVPLQNLPPHLATCPVLKMINLKESAVAIPENLLVLQSQGKLTIQMTV